jgi:hypothetical protein
MHYNSVRCADDYGSGPPQPVRVAVAAAADPAALAAAARRFGQSEVDQVVAGTGCADSERVSRVLSQCGGSVDQAIEQLIEELGREGDGSADAAEAGGGQPQAAGQPEDAEQQQQQQVASVPQQAAASRPGPEEQQQHEPGRGGQQPALAAQAPLSCQVRLELRPLPCDPGSMAVLLHAPAADAPLLQQPAEPAGVQQRGAAAQLPEDPGGAAALQQRRGAKRSSGKKGVRVKEAKVAGRNQRCPCGSTRKYKNCCGVLRGERGATAVGGTAGGGAAGDEVGGPRVDDAAVVKQLQVLHI